VGKGGNLGKQEKKKHFQERVRIGDFIVESLDRFKGGSEAIKEREESSKGRKRRSRPFPDVGLRKSE